MNHKNKYFQYTLLILLSVFITSCARPISTIEERESWGASNFTGENDRQLNYYYSSFFAYTPNVYFSSSAYFDQTPISNEKLQLLSTSQKYKDNKYINFHSTMPLKGFSSYDPNKSGGFRFTQTVNYLSGVTNMFIAHKEEIQTKEKQNNLIATVGLKYFNETIGFIESTFGMKCDYIGFTEKYQYTDVQDINHFPGSYRRRTKKCSDSVNYFLVSVTTILTPTWRYEITGNTAETVLTVNSISQNNSGFNSNVLLPDVYEHFKSVAPIESSALVFCLVCSLRKDPDGTVVVWSKGKEQHISFNQLYRAMD